MKMPEDINIKLDHHKFTTADASNIAGDIIEKLDDTGYSRAEVKKIAEWVHYLSTQD